MQSDWEDRKGRFPIHCLFDAMSLDTYLPWDTMGNTSLLYIPSREDKSYGAVTCHKSYIISNGI